MPVNIFINIGQRAFGMLGDNPSETIHAIFWPLGTSPLVRDRGYDQFWDTVGNGIGVMAIVWLLFGSIGLYVSWRKWKP